MKSIKIIPLFILMFCLCFSACSKVKNSDTSSFTDSTGSQVSIVDSAPQQNQSQTEIIVSEAEDSNDPEIMKNNIGNGNKVEINKVKNKTPEITSKPNNSTESFVEYDMTFKTVKPVNVTAKEETNLREAPTTDSNIIYTLKNGEYVTKNAISDSGWARLEYNGKIVYAVNSFLFGAE